MDKITDEQMEPTQDTQDMEYARKYLAGTRYRCPFNDLAHCTEECAFYAMQEDEHDCRGGCLLSSAIVSLIYMQRDISSIDDTLGAVMDENCGVRIYGDVTT